MKEGVFTDSPLSSLVRLMRIFECNEQIGVSMRIIRDVYSLPPVCIAKIYKNIGTPKQHSKIFVFYELFLHIQ
jgi:hypothetical protein